MFYTPILFLIYNRPETTLEVFNVIRSLKPYYLYIAADGPKFADLNDQKKCSEVREHVIKNIDWDCQVNTLLRDSNLGCGKAVSEAITWFFDHVEEGIILEDDCVPYFSFFQFCEELLLKYRDVNAVAHISGNNFQCGKIRGKADYYFSNFPHIWGWATWRRAWENYHFEIGDLDVIKRDRFLRKIAPLNMMQLVKEGKIDTWDTQWHYSHLLYHKLAILPNKNLIKNIGFSENATHTKGRQPQFITRSKFGDLQFPLTHPKKYKADKEADLYTAKIVYGLNKNSFIISLLNKLFNIINMRSS